MKKTSLYLSEELDSALGRAARQLGRSRAEVVREALTEYVTKTPQRKRFALDGAATKPGKRNIAKEDIDKTVTAIITERLRDERA